MSSKRPWMPLYIDDYLSGTGHLEPHEHGAYLLLMMRYWSKGSLPDDEDQIRRISRLNEGQWKKSVSVLKSFFVDGWKHERLDAELAKAIGKSKVNSANAKERYRNRTPIADEVVDDFGPNAPAFVPAIAPAIAHTLQTPDSIKKEEGANAPSSVRGFVGSLIDPAFMPTQGAIAEALNVDCITSIELTEWLNDWKQRCMDAGTRLEDWHAAWAREYHRRSIERAKAKPKPRISVSKKPKLTKIPDGWAPNDGHHEIANERNLDVNACIHSFADYIINKQPDWRDADASFRNWLKSPHRTEFKRNGQAQTTHRRAPAPGGSILDAFDRLDARIDAAAGRSLAGDQWDVEAAILGLPEE